jgi:hypothetical protein
LLEDTLFILETAAVVHDGIMASLGKLGSSGGKCQEQEPVAVPIRMLGGLGFATEAIDMVAPSR